jgi:Holliday junction resolvase RusA-like endonuclease
MKLSTIVVRFMVLGVVPSLKNQKRLGKGRMFDDSQVQRYKADFGLQVPPQYRNLALGTRLDPLEATIRLLHDSWRRDADAEIIFDCLQTAGVVSNDRWIRRKFIYAETIDPLNPRAEITVSYIG